MIRTVVPVVHRLQRSTVLRDSPDVLWPCFMHLFTDQAIGNSLAEKVCRLSLAEYGNIVAQGFALPCGAGGREFKVPRDSFVHGVADIGYRLGETTQQLLVARAVRWRPKLPDGLEAAFWTVVRLCHEGLALGRISGSGVTPDLGECFLIRSPVACKVRLIGDGNATLSSRRGMARRCVAGIIR